MKISDILHKQLYWEILKDLTQSLRWDHEPKFRNELDLELEIELGEEWLFLI